MGPPPGRAATQTLGLEPPVLAPRAFRKWRKYGRSPGIRFSVFKKLSILLFFSPHIQYSWLLSGRKCGEVGEVWSTEGKLAT